MAVLGLGDEKAGDERAECQRQPCACRRPGRSEAEENDGEQKDVAAPRSDDVMQQARHDPARGDHRATDEQKRLGDHP